MWGQNVDQDYHVLLWHLSPKSCETTNLFVAYDPEARACAGHSFPLCFRLLWSQISSFWFHRQFWSPNLSACVWYWMLFGFFLGGSGMGPDSRVLVRKSRKQAQQYQRLYQVWNPGLLVVDHVIMWSYLCEMGLEVRLSYLLVWTSESLTEVNFSVRWYYMPFVATFPRRTSGKM